MIWYLNKKTVLKLPQMKDLQFGGYLKSGMTILIIVPIENHIQSKCSKIFYHLWFLYRRFSAWENVSCGCYSDFEYINGCTTRANSNGRTSNMLASMVIFIPSCGCSSFSGPGN